MLEKTYWQESKLNVIPLYELLKVLSVIMVLFRYAKWIYAAAGSGIAIGVFNYMQSEKKCVQASWTTNFEPSVKWDYNWDKRELSSMIKPAKDENDPNEQNRINEERENKKSTAYRVLILIRHGQYHDSEKHDKDRKLTDLGRKQADCVGRRLKELDFNYTKLTYSTMTRARETAEIILKHLPSDIPTESDDMLREGSPIPPEPPSGSWRPEKQQFFKDGARIEAAFRKYFHRADPKQKTPSYEIIVCHANVIRYFLCRALQFPPEGWLRFSLHHCSITSILISPSGSVVVTSVGDRGFIPKDTMSV